MSTPTVIGWRCEAPLINHCWGLQELVAQNMDSYNLGIYNALRLTPNQESF